MIMIDERHESLRWAATNRGLHYFPSPACGRPRPRRAGETNPQKRNQSWRGYGSWVISMAGYKKNGSAWHSYYKKKKCARNFPLKWTKTTWKKKAEQRKVNDLCILDRWTNEGLNSFLNFRNRVRNYKNPEIRNPEIRKTKEITN